MSAKYNQIGINYNQTRKADPHLTEQLLKHLNPKKEDLYLDIGCGTGNYTSELQKKGFQFIGIDPSIEMLQKAQTQNDNIQWKIGSAEKTDLPQHSIDGIIGTLTIHHWTNLARAFSELEYILKPDGKIVIFTSTPQQMEGYWLNHYFPKMLEDSMVQMPTLKTIEEAMNSSGLKVTSTNIYNIEPDLVDQFLYCGKQNPELYFDDSIRHGISSFSALANLEEVETGLAQLRKDIDSGKINTIINSYENNLGDYLYIIGEKTKE
ncbi:class I SAM-dependent methyltransferase [Winogradskyella sp. PG-2]|uniref:class I SAM-dependent methyltransferase n=1 Tax=Winogradskyella sp. PG-2 TaxID=754409 RepID=UPI0004586BB3|nr:class I SAM-dependent methyltransferase [Winogradskyella sp. PG-2]BAO76712.1 ubiquinone/menaquinone biosynthesis methyltransferase UbiE [Winogradskyella sp. PG-2]